MNSISGAALPASGMTEHQRISVVLDAGLVLERLILKRLSGLKRTRGQAWLRSLLAQGFLTEGRWLRSEIGAAATLPATPPTAFASWLGGPKRAPKRAPKLVQPRPRQTDSGTEQGLKPFAYLRKVIG
jgi:hypothetical protein